MSVSVDVTHIRTSTQWAAAVEYTDCISADPTPYKCPEYDTKQYNGDAPALEIWRNSGPLFPGVEASDRILSMG